MRPSARSNHQRPFTWLCLLVLLAGGCGPRVGILTGTTLGIKVTPGDGSTRPPQVTLGYKRAEAALVPTKGEKATRTTDAFSTLAVFYLQTEWFGDTEIASFIGTGSAAKDILATGSTFKDEFAPATLGAAPAELQERRERLSDQLINLTEDQAKAVLHLAGHVVKPSKTAKQSLQDSILDAQTEAQLLKLESAFNRLR